MPSKSMKQHKFMEAVAHNPSFARMVKVPQKVGREFVTADSRDHRGSYHEKQIGNAMKAAGKRTKNKQKIGGNMSVQQPLYRVF